MNQAEILKLKAKARRRRAEAEAQQSQTDPDDRGGFANTGFSGGELIEGALEVGKTIVTGAGAQIAGGFGGLMAAGKEGEPGFDVDAAGDATRGIIERRTFQPKSRVGKTLLGMVGEVVEPFMEGVQNVSDKAFEATGSPAVGAAVQTVGELTPAALGMKVPGSGRSVAGRLKDINKVKEGADRINLNMDQHIEGQRAEIVAQAAKEAGAEITPEAEIIPRGQSLEGVQSGVQVARKAAEDAANTLYTEARATPAGVPVQQARIFIDSVRKSTEGLILEDMPKVRGMLKRLEKIEKLPDGSHVKLNAMEEWRKSINRNMPAIGDEAQFKEMVALKRQYDQFRDHMFNSDMIKGDPSSISKWKKATKAWSEYEKTFNDNKVIYQLAKQEATPETMRKWIFGSSEVGFQTEAASVIKRLKTILGEDSPQMVALRQDAILNILDPLLSRNPDFSAFVKNYNKVLAKNSSLVKELFPESETALRELRDFARAVDSRNPKKLGIDLDVLLARAGFGHGIAKAALKVSIARHAINLVRSSVNKSSRQQIMADVLGYDPGSPLIPPALVPTLGATVQALDDSDDTDQSARPDSK